MAYDDFDYGSLDFGSWDPGYDYGGGGGASPVVYDQGGGTYNPGTSWDASGWEGIDQGGGGGYVPPPPPAPSRDIGRYLPGGADYIPPGGGQFQTGNQPWQQIYAPGGQHQQTYRGAGYGRPPAAPSNINASASNLAPYTGGMGSNPLGGKPIGGGGGGGSSGSQTQQQIALGQPDTELYNRYKNQLLNPEGMAGDPAYKFLFNQGEQALKRSLAAKRLMYSGKSLADTTQFGQGMAYDYMNKMLPQYQAGAREELTRFLGPAELLPRYAASNNRAIESDQSRRMLQDYMGSQGGDGGGSGFSAAPLPSSGGSFGGVSSDYNPTRRLQQEYAPPNYYQPPQQALPDWDELYTGP